MKRPARLCECGDHGFANTSAWGVTMWSPSDHDMASSRDWTMGGGATCRYAASGRGNTTTYLHRLILPAAKFVDHINGNGLDNRRQNIRSVTHAQNQANSSSRRGSSSKYRGVSWDSRRQHWIVQIEKSHKRYYGGSFKSEDEAALAFNARAVEIFGPYAKLNVVELANV